MKHSSKQARHRYVVPEWWNDRTLIGAFSRQACRSARKNIKHQVKRCRVQYHEVLPAEDDPEGEQHGVEDALPDVPEKQHPGPVEADGEPLYWDVDERHGDTQSQDYPEGAKTSL